MIERSRMVVHPAFKVVRGLRCILQRTGMSAAERTAAAQGIAMLIQRYEWRQVWVAVRAR